MQSAGEIFLSYDLIVEQTYILVEGLWDCVRRNIASFFLKNLSPRHHILIFTANNILQLFHYCTLLTWANGTV